MKPPYGVLSAINLDRGELMWQVPHGDTPDNIRNHPVLEGMNIPKTGQAGTSGVGLMVTKTIVVMGDPQITTTPEHPRGAMLRAYDKAHGQGSRRGVDAGAAERIADDLHGRRQAVHHRRRRAAATTRASTSRSRCLVRRRARPAAAIRTRCSTVDLIVRTPRKLAAIVLTGAVLRASPARAAEPPVAFRNVTVIPMDRERVETGQTVLVRDDRIVAIGAADEISIPDDATVVDGKGRFLLPGLTDAHVHIADLHGQPRHPTSAMPRCISALESPRF